MTALAGAVSPEWARPARRWGEVVVDHSLVHAPESRDHPEHELNVSQVGTPGCLRLGPGRPIDDDVTEQNLIRSRDGGRKRLGANPGQLGSGRGPLGDRLTARHVVGGHCGDGLAPAAVGEHVQGLTHGDQLRRQERVAGGQDPRCRDARGPRARQLVRVGGAPPVAGHVRIRFLLRAGDVRRRGRRRAGELVGARAQRGSEEGTEARDKRDARQEEAPVPRGRSSRGSPVEGGVGTHGSVISVVARAGVRGQARVG